jgi:hypothetical protein
MWLNPGASFINTALGVGEAVEDLFINPEDIDLEPEDIQTDCDDWTILPDAD